MTVFDNIGMLDECVAAQFPCDMEATDGTPLTVTPMVASDWEMLERFLKATPQEEHRYFRRDASDPARVERWCSELDYRHTLPLLAWHGDQIVADGILQRDAGLWTSHVGTVRLLVHPDFRRRGIGTAMMRQLVTVAAETDLHKVKYDCAADQQDLLEFLMHTGFVEAARLPEFIRDSGGRLHEMVVMVRDLA
jgi:GNAT superfamily N-acetyltransferase